MMKKLKLGDLVVCCTPHTMLTYAKVMEITNKLTGEKYNSYDDLSSEIFENKNHVLTIRVKALGLESLQGFNEFSVSNINYIDDVYELSPTYLYRVIDEDIIKKIKKDWEDLIEKKISFFLDNVNKPVLSGKKFIKDFKLS